MSEAAARHPRPPVGAQNSSCQSSFQLGVQHRGHTPHPRTPRASEQSWPFLRLPGNLVTAATLSRSAERSRAPAHSRHFACVDSSHPHSHLGLPASPTGSQLRGAKPPAHGRPGSRNRTCSSLPSRPASAAGTVGEGVRAAEMGHFSPDTRSECPHPSDCPGNRIPPAPLPTPRTSIPDEPGQRHPGRLARQHGLLSHGGEHHRTDGGDRGWVWWGQMRNVVPNSLD